MNYNIVKELGGVYPALLTPFTKENTINRKALEDLVEYNIQKGVTGFYVGGSTAEAFLLTEEERNEVYEIVAEKAAGRVKLIAHIGSISTDQAVRFGLRAKALNYDAISAVAPFYYGFTFPEIKQYYFDIVARTEMPMVMYNIPGTSGVKLSTAQIAEILSGDGIIGLKHTSNDYFAMEQVKTKFQDKVIFNGFDEMFLCGLSMGADGGIGSTYNYMAEKFIKIRRLFAENKMAEALEVQREANRIIKILIDLGGMQMNKEVLCQMGFDFGNARAPFIELTAEQKELIRREVTSKL
ncbi:MAG: N-acetylneuraminate lyase [Clostridia bacterium]|nr:N-acetylneuraminate lyase [Clostridia bacterium]